MRLAKYLAEEEKEKRRAWCTKNIENFSISGKKYKPENLGVPRPLRHPKKNIRPGCARAQDRVASTFFRFADFTFSFLCLLEQQPTLKMVSMTIKGHNVDVTDGDQGNDNINVILPLL